MKKTNDITANNKGITLISLVITIIILLILAGISIATLTGENGLIARTQQAKTKNEEAEKNELWNLDMLDLTIEEMLTGNKTLYPVQDKNPGVLAGNGTSNNPFLIESVEDLKAFSDATNNGNTFAGQTIKLNQTLDLNSPLSYADKKSLETNGIKDQFTNLTKFSGFPMISQNLNIDLDTYTFEGAFQGTFDGNNHTLKNVKVKSTNIGNGFAGAGLFGAIGNTGMIKNINLIVEVTLDQLSTNSSLGGLSAANLGTIQNSNINIAISGIDTTSNSKTDNALLLGGATGFNVGTASKLNVICNISALESSSVGGITGQNVGKILNCNTQGTIAISIKEKSWSNVGGIAGHNTNIIINNISDCSLNVATSTNVNMGVGGIVGDNVNNDNSPTKKVENNYSKCSFSLARNGSGNLNCGGIIGYAGSNSNINNCYFNGSFTNTDLQITPYNIIGWANKANIQNCKYKKAVNSHTNPIGNASSCKVIAVNEDINLTDNSVFTELNNYIKSANNPELIEW